MNEKAGNFWVFGYGSLMWRPGFHFAERQKARLIGWHRALCIYSYVHRGTQQTPGLVLGLDAGGHCDGVAFRVLASRWQETVAYLRERELVTQVYRESTIPVILADGRAVQALCYVVDPMHPQYAGRLAKPDLLRLVLQGHGISGANTEYVRSTHQHLRELAITDETLAWLDSQLDPSD